MRDLLPAAEAALCSVLRALASPSELQAALYADGRCAPCAVAYMLTFWAREFQDAFLERPTTAPQRQALERLAETADAATRSHACHDTTALSTGAEFAALRQAANTTLAEFGWAAGSLDPQYIPGLPEHAARCEQMEQERQRNQRDARRSGKAKLRHHNALFASLGITPAVSRRNARLLRQREQTLGIRFPESVFEFFSIAGVAELFRERTTEDELVTNDEFDEGKKLNQFGDPREIHQGYLCVAVENQGIVSYYVLLNDAADPPVVHDNGHVSADLSKTEWVPVAGRFSEFLRTLMGVGEEVP